MFWYDLQKATLKIVLREKSYLNKTDSVGKDYKVVLY